MMRSMRKAEPNPVQGLIGPVWLGARSFDLFLVQREFTGVARFLFCFADTDTLMLDVSVKNLSSCIFLIFLTCCISSFLGECGRYVLKV